MNCEEQKQEATHGADQVKRLIFITDTTGSMSEAFQAVKGSIECSAKYLNLLGIQLVVVLYGDYGNYVDNKVTAMDRVVTILDSSEPNFFEKLRRYNLNDNGGGADIVEALNTALYTVLKRYPPSIDGSEKQGVVVIADACGDTNKTLRCYNSTTHSYEPLDQWIKEKRSNTSTSMEGACRTCTAEKMSRMFERDLLRSVGIEEEDCNFHYFMEEMMRNRYVVSLIKNTDCAPDSLYQTTGGIRMVHPLTIQNVTSSLFKIIGNYLGLVPSDQKTPVVIPGIESLRWSQKQVDEFRDLVHQDPRVLEHLPFAPLYYRSINILAKMPEVEGKANLEKGLNAHGHFMQNLHDKVPKDIIDIFKNAQNELMKKPMAELQSNDPDDVRLYVQPMLLSKLSEILSFTSRDRDAMEQLKTEVSQIKISASTAESADGISLSVIQTNPLNLISYIGRERGFYVPVSKALCPVFYAAIMKWSEIQVLKEIVLERINEQSFLDSDLILQNPTSYNMAYLLFIWRTFKKLIPKKTNNIFKMWRLCNLASILQKPITCECSMDASKMSKEALLRCATGVSMSFDVALQLWYPAHIFVPCNEQKVQKIVQNMKNEGENRWTAEHRGNLIALVREFKIIYLSTYACNFYKKYVDREETKQLDMYMTNSFVKNHPETNGLSLRDQYTRFIGPNGEHVFTTLINHADILSGGAKNCICSSRECRKIYAIADSRFSPDFRCVECRTRHRQRDDRAPLNVVTCQTIRCAVGHEFVSGFDTSNIVIPSDKCPLCNISVEKATISTPIQVENFFRENITFSAQFMIIDQPLLSKLLETKSAYKTVMIDTLATPADVSSPGESEAKVEPKVQPKVEQKVINIDFAKWGPMIGAEHKDDESVLRVNGLPLTTSSREKILGLLKDHLMIECGICSTMKYISFFKDVCTNDHCTGDICMDCANTVHGFPENFTGKIQVSKAACSFCRAPVNRNSKAITSTITRLLVKKYKEPLIISPNTGVGYTSWVGALLAGEDVRKCTESKCLDPTCLGFFMALKQRCGAAGEAAPIADEKVPDDTSGISLCPACNDVRTKNQAYLNEWKSLGFHVVGDMILRQCPNPACRQGVNRRDGCAHMTCICGQNFCYCCGTAFPNANATYTHLNQLFRTYFPTDAQIKEQLRNPGEYVPPSDDDSEEEEEDDDI